MTPKTKQRIYKLILKHVKKDMNVSKIEITQDIFDRFDQDNEVFPTEVQFKGNRWDVVNEGNTWFVCKNNIQDIDLEYYYDYTKSVF